MANVVVWPSVFEQFRPEVMGSRVLMVEGKLRRSPENVVHVIAERLFDRTADIDELSDDVFGPQSDMPDTGGMHRHPRRVRVIPKSRDFTDARECSNHGRLLGAGRIGSSVTFH